jgi:hypothetical protein
MAHYESVVRRNVLSQTVRSEVSSSVFVSLKACLL